MIQLSEFFNRHVIFIGYVAAIVLIICGIGLLLSSFTGGAR